MLLLNDRVLLQRFRRGDREAMAIVFHHYADPVARYLQRGFVFESQGRPLRFDGLPSRHDLHDFVFETFRRAFEERARLAYDGLGPYERYLRTISRNLVIDALRSSHQRLRSVPLEEGQATASAEPGPALPEQPEQAALRAELRALLLQVLEQLTVEERQLVALRFDEGLAQEEVAQRLGRTRRWVRTAEEKIRGRLLRHLKSTGYLPRAREGARR